MLGVQLGTFRTGPICCAPAPRCWQRAWGAATWLYPELVGDVRGPPISCASPSSVESWPLRARWISSSLVEKSPLSGLWGKGWWHRPAAFCLLGSCMLGACVMTPGSHGPWVEGRKRPVSQPLILGTWAGSRSQSALATSPLLRGCFDCELPALPARLEAQQGLECKRCSACSEDVLVPVSPGKKSFFH